MDGQDQMPESSGADSPIWSLRARLERLDCRVLIVGSLPPGGRDYDLMVHSSCRLAVQEAIEADGFELFRDQWIRLSPGRIEVIDLMTTDDWGLSGPAASRLFDDSQPIPGLHPLFAPSPAHQLVVLARKFPQGGGRISFKHFGQIESVLNGNPHAWDAAGPLAEQWGLDRGLRHLRRRFEHGPRASDRVRVGRRGGTIVALSGLDGAGKTTHAQLLHNLLSGLGRDVAVVWSPSGQVSGLARLALAAKTRLARLPFGPLAKADPGTIAEPLFKAAHDPVMPENRALLLAIWLWWFVVTVADALTRWRVAIRATVAGRIVIFDRYALDSLVDLCSTSSRFAGRQFIERLVCRMSPRPAVAILLALPPEVAHARKSDWSLAETRARATLYDCEHGRLKMKVVEATAPLEETSAQIARLVISEIW